MRFDQYTLLCLWCSALALAWDGDSDYRGDSDYHVEALLEKSVSRPAVVAVQADSAQWNARREPSECALLADTLPASDWAAVALCFESYGDLRTAWEIYTMCHQDASVAPGEAALAATELARLRAAYPLAARLGEAISSLKAKFACFVLCLLVVVQAPWRSAGLSLPARAALTFAAHFYVDLLFGTIHMLLDSPAALHLPALGTFVTDFQHHHSSVLNYDHLPWPAFLA